MTQHLSAFQLDAAALGALAVEGRAHLESCADCRARANEGQALRDELSAHVMTRTMTALRHRRRRRFAVLASLMVPAVAVVLWLVLGPAKPVDNIPEVAIKGGPALQVYARSDQRVFRVRDGEVLRAGDEIRFAVTPAGASYVLIASVDGRGHVTIYVPYDGLESVAIDPHHPSELPGSIILDDAMGPERLFAIFSTAPVRVADVWPTLQGVAAAGPEALRTSRRLDLHVQATQASIVFQKEAP
jgi:hypothetical protein